MDGDDEPGQRPTTRFEPVRVGSAPRRLGRWAVLAALALGLVVAKPWSPPEPRPGSGAATIPAASARGSVPSHRVPTRPAASAPHSEADAEMRSWCLGPATWRSASSETWRDRTVRVWRAMEPVEAYGPLDPTIEPVPLAGVRVEAAGFCAPVSGPNRLAGSVRVTAWRVVAGSAEPIALRQVVPSRGETRLGRLWSPPDGGTGEGWPVGRYVFRVDDEAGRRLWWAFEVDGGLGGELVAPTDGSPAPAADRRTPRAVARGGPSRAVRPAHRSGRRSGHA